MSPDFSSGVRRIGVLTTRAGSTSTYWATCLAWTLAQERQVTLIDADPGGGTVADLLQLKDPVTGTRGGRSIARIWGGVNMPISAADIASQAMAHPSRPNLRVVPGYDQSYGPKISDLLIPMRDALKNMPDDFVICDLGQCLAYPGLREPSLEAEEISNAFSRVFVVVRDDPALYARTIETLRAAKLPTAELVICSQRNHKLKDQMRQVLAEAVTDMPFRPGWEWDEKMAAKMGGQWDSYDPARDRALNSALGDFDQPGKIAKR